MMRNGGQTDFPGVADQLHADSQTDWQTDRKSTTYLELRHFGFFLISQAVFDGPAFKSGQQVLQQVGLKHRPY